MHAVALRLRAELAEDALDRLLPLAPLGVYERDLGPLVEAVLLPGRRGLPARDQLAAAAGPALAGLVERELPDDVGERLARLVEAPVAAGRFVIRSPAAQPPADPRLEDIVIERGSAFGTGLHPTTRRCLELLVALEPGGSLADLGCGTGVLAIGAARLGFEPVTAVDYDETSVEAAARNAAANGVAVEARVLDLLAEPPPAARTLVANVPARVQAAVRARLAEPPRHVVASGVTPAEADAVAASYAELGLVERRRLVEAGWAAVLLTKADVDLREPERRSAAPRLRVLAGAGAGLEGETAPFAPPPERLPGQLESALPDGGVALSTTRELPTGARVAVVLVPGVLRVDVRHLEDTLKISVRNLSGAPIRTLPDRGAPRTVLTGESVSVARPLTTNSSMRLRAGAGAQAREVSILLSSASGVEPGLARIVAQALVGPASG